MTTFLDLHTAMANAFDLFSKRSTGVLSRVAVEMTQTVNLEDGANCYSNIKFERQKNIFRICFFSLQTMAVYKFRSMMICYICMICYILCDKKYTFRIEKKYLRPQSRTTI